MLMNCLLVHAFSFSVFNVFIWRDSIVKMFTVIISLNTEIGYSIKTPIQYIIHNCGQIDYVIHFLDLLTVKSIALSNRGFNSPGHVFIYVWTKDVWFCLELSLLIGIVYCFVKFKQRHSSECTLQHMQTVIISLNALLWINNLLWPAKPRKHML